MLFFPNRCSVCMLNVGTAVEIRVLAAFSAFVSSLNFYNYVLYL